MIFDMVLSTLRGDNVARFLADHIEEKYSNHPQTKKMAERLRADVRIVTLVAVVAQFGCKWERKVIQKAQRVYRGRHKLGNSTDVVQNHPGMRYRILATTTGGDFWREFHKTILEVMENEIS